MLDLNAGQIALPLERIVVLQPTHLLRSAIEQMSEKKLGIACIVNSGKLIGVFTDGDIRRMLLRDHRPFAALFSEDVADFMTSSPKTVHPSVSLRDAVIYMEKNDVLDLPVVDSSERLVGLLHLHTALKTLLNI